MSSITGNGDYNKALRRVKKITSLVTETTAPTTAVNNGYIDISTPDIAYVAFFDGTTGIQQYVINDYMGEFTIQDIAFYDVLLLESGDTMLLEDGTRFVMEG